MRIRINHRQNNTAPVVVVLPVGSPRSCGHIRLVGWCPACQREQLHRHHEQDAAVDTILRRNHGL